MLNLHCFVIIADDKDLFYYCIVSFAVKPGIKKIVINKNYCIDETLIEFDKIFQERNIYVLLLTALGCY